MTAAYFLIIMTANATTVVPFASRDFCTAALEALQKLDTHVQGACVSSGAVERSGEQRQ